MAFGNRRQVEIERRGMRLEACNVDASAVLSAATPTTTGLSSNTPNLLARRSGAQIIFTFSKNYTEAPVVNLTPIGAQGTGPSLLALPTSTGFTAVTSAASDDFTVMVLGSEKPSV
jgi:hypothetical protein